VRNKGVSPGVTEVGQGLQILEAEGSHASVSWPNPVLVVQFTFFKTAIDYSEAMHEFWSAGVVKQ
jgi:hypothetical protein